MVQQREPIVFKRPSQQSREERQARLGTCMRSCGPAMMKDGSGNVWCEHCINRYRLIQWGIANKFPSISFPPRAISSGAEAYRIQSIMAHDTWIDAAFQAMTYLDTLKQ